MIIFRAHSCRKTLLPFLMVSVLSLGSSGATATSHFPESQSGARIVVQSPGPIMDSLGRIRHIVDLHDDDMDKPPRFDKVSLHVDWKKAKSAQLIDDVVKLRGVDLVGSTGLVGTSFTAYLTERQVEQFSKDNRVKLITQDVYLQPSALWNNSGAAPGQVTPWGIQAMAAGGGGSNGSATVYVIDLGVGTHPDLPGLSEQLVVAAGISPVGCYPHATHVAGIIGAANNGFGVVGVLPGARIVSIAIGENASALCPSIPNTLSSSTIGYGFDKAMERIQISGKVSVVNLSFNAGGALFSANGTLGMKMRALATPTFTYWPYRGALVVQSAGNQFQDACNYAFNAPSPNDGIMVVGGLDENGQAARPLNGMGGYYFGVGSITGSEAGSNTGGCVEVWAPSQRVLSTWSVGTHLLSGTSMAAPHVAGFAARLIESDANILTSTDLETAVRARFTTIGGSFLSMPRFVSTNENAAPTIEIAQGSNRSSVAPISFSEFPDLANFRFESVGASSCTVALTRYGSSWWWYNYATAQNLVTNLPWGQYVWNVTCSSAQGTQSSATATGYLKRRISATWNVYTTSTSGNWQALDNFTTVWWSIADNGPFSQTYSSSNSDYCQVESFGFTGNSSGDANGNNPPNPNFSPVPQFTQSPVLWDSGPYYPANYDFGTLFFSDPWNNPQYGLAPFNGYKWRLTCWNYDGDSVVRVMYGIGM